jgi:hypothetical protein
MTVDVWITSERKGPSDMSVAKLGSPVLVAKRVHPGVDVLPTNATAARTIMTL